MLSIFNCVCNNYCLKATSFFRLPIRWAMEKVTVSSLYIKIIKHTIVQQKSYTKSPKINFFKAIPSSIRNFFFQIQYYATASKNCTFFRLLENLLWWTDSNNWIFPIFLQFSGGAMLAKLLGPPTRKIISFWLRNQRAKETTLTYYTAQTKQTVPEILILMNFVVFTVLLPCKICWFEKLILFINF